MEPRVTFYDIPFTARLAIAAKLASAAWERKRHLLITTADPTIAEQVDDFLWTFKAEAFIPHARWPSPEPLEGPDARILLADGQSQLEAIPGRDVILQLDPAPLDFAAEFTAVIDFVGRDDEALLAKSRERYRQWQARGIKPEFKRS